MFIEFSQTVEPEPVLPAALKAASSLDNSRHRHTAMPYDKKIQAL